MRPSNKSRSRNKSGGMGGNPSMNPNHNRQRLGNIINRVFESAGPEGKVRGTPQQIIEKYQALARDAQLSGDRVAAESFLQFAEHYTRLLGEAQAAQAEARQVFEREDGQPRDGGRDGGRRDEARRDEGPRDGGQRDGGQRDGSRRDDREGGERPRFEGGPRAVEPQLSSGLATIDTDDGETGGLIETPESASQADAEPQAVANGSHHPAGEAAGEPVAAAPDEKPAAKRARPRRRAPKAEGEAQAAVE